MATPLRSRPYWVGAKSFGVTESATVSPKVFAPGGSRNAANTGASAAVGRPVAWVFWGKPVFRLTASGQLAESLAPGRVQFQRDGTSTQA